MRSNHLISCTPFESATVEKTISTKIFHQLYLQLQGQYYSYFVKELCTLFFFSNSESIMLSPLLKVIDEKQIKKNDFIQKS